MTERVETATVWHVSMARHRLDVARRRREALERRYSAEAMPLVSMWLARFDRSDQDIMEAQAELNELQSRRKGQADG